VAASDAGQSERPSISPTTFRPYGGFVAPAGLTAAVGLVAAPLWNLLLLLPLGVLLGWLAGRRAAGRNPNPVQT